METNTVSMFQMDILAYHGFINVIPHRNVRKLRLFRHSDHSGIQKREFKWYCFKKKRTSHRWTFHFKMKLKLSILHLGLSKFNHYEHFFWILFFSELWSRYCSCWIMQITPSHPIFEHLQSSWELTAYIS